MDSHEARYAEVSLTYEGRDISCDIAPYLLNFTYTDNSSDKADDISLTLEDKERLWCSDWFPTKGDKIRASIIIHNWEAANRTQSLKTVSTLVSKPMRQEKHTKAWENVKLSAIAGDAASKSGLALFWDSPENPFFERRDQVEVSDLEFLCGLCKDYGIAVKVTDTQLVCYDEETYEGKGAVGELAFGDKKLIRWSFSTKTAGTYKSARLQYHDSVKDETYTVSAGGDAEGTGRVLEINQKADNIGDAQKIAAEKLRQANKKEITANITLMGDLRFVGGSNITISGFGAFDGKYVIEKATHTVGDSYTTKLDLRMGGDSKKSSRKKSAKKGKTRRSKTSYEEMETYSSSGNFDFQNLIKGS